AGHPLGAAGQFGRGLAARLVLGAAGQLLRAAVNLLLCRLGTSEQPAAGDQQAEGEEQSGKQLEHIDLREKVVETVVHFPWPCSQARGDRMSAVRRVRLD